jgi:hypothetical protein
VQNFQCVDFVKGSPGATLSAESSLRSNERPNRIGTFIPQKKLLTSVGLADTLQQKPLAESLIPYFPHRIAKNPVDFRAKVPLKSRFSTLYSSLNHDRCNLT